MSPVDLHRAARAAGAAAFAYHSGEGVLTLGEGADGFGLVPGDLPISTLLDRLGPADRALLETGLGAPELDVRIRLIVEDGHIVYLRWRGQKDADGLTHGLIQPAGAPGLGGAARIHSERALTEGLDAGDIIAFYQPIIDLKTQALAGFEALARWMRPGRGILAPDDFLGLADDLDKLGDIGQAVRGHAIRDLATWRQHVPTAKTVFVAANAAVSELVEPGFAAHLIEEIHRAGLPADRFKLEVAETEIMRDADRALAAMQMLAGSGISLALDDFGTGYSSLARLDSLPFHVVKIDRYFVRALSMDEQAGTIVKSVIQLARHYKMKCVAEGVEDAETASRLAEMGCDYAQGFQFAGALAPDDALSVLRHGRPGRFSPPTE